MEFPAARKYTREEKQQLLANLDIEVAHRARQFHSWLADALENFRIHQEGQISRIPKQVRNLTVREFGEKYNGDMQTALRGLQLEKYGDAEGSLREIDKSTRKRKWVASQEAEGQSSGPGAPPAPTDAEPNKASKNARLMATPKKKAGSSTGPGTAQRARLLAAGNKTPGITRTISRIPAIPASPSPQKTRPPFSTSTFPRIPSRQISPTKASPAKPSLNGRPARPPSTATFNPVIPKTPAYPGAAARLPRRDESMLSVNGSPLANPYEFGLGWFRGIEHGEHGDAAGAESSSKGGGDKTIKRSNSIIIRRDPSFSYGPSSNGTSGFHSRSNSQASIFTTSSQPTSSSHSRSPSEAVQTPPESALLHPDATPKPHNLVRSNSYIASALVAIPTTDGHFLEFDPLQASPEALDALEGISSSAKKKAKEEVARLVQAAVDKWKIT